MFDINKLASIKVGLASPKKIRDWSHGEVTKQETINYHSHKPVMDGLFCERIFGPTKDYTCNCGKYNKPYLKGTVCDKCGVEIISKDSRRERMGHITLAAPCSHIWYLKAVPSRMSLLLDIKAKELEEIIYYISHVCLNPGRSTKLAYKQVIGDDKAGRDVFKEVIEEIRDGLDPESHDYKRAESLIEKLEDQQSSFIYFEYVDFIKQHTDAEFGEGAKAIKVLLQQVDLEAEFEAVEKEIKKDKTGGQKLTKLVKKLDVINAFRTSGNKPEWMILDILPVIPPDLRPLLQLDGGRFAASPLNDLYKRVISRNTRLKELIEKNSPYIMIMNESRMLQDAVDNLIDNGRRTGKKVTNSSGIPYKSLSTILKGKQGRFRMNLLGKRVDYSGRSVIAVGPSLKMYQCGLPREMAIALLRPFIASILLKEKKCTRHGEAERKIDARDEDVLKIVQDIISEHPVLLNRAPTLHRLGIQAFQPVLVEGRAIRLHPLVCAGFNADFDGDQMAVHVPIRKEAQEEALHLMLASNNILSPSSGKPIAIPSQDMLIGNYYLTTELNVDDFLKRAKYFRDHGDENEALKYERYAQEEGKVFKSIDECYKAYLNKEIHLNTRVAFLGSAMKKDGFTEKMNNSYLITTVGKMIFNLIFPSDFPYINDAASGQLGVNLQGECEEYFVEPGTDIKAYIAKQPLKRPVVKGGLQEIINELFKRYGTTKTSAILDKIKDQGFKFSTIYGLTISIFDIDVLPEKDELIAKGDARIVEIEQEKEEGGLKEADRFKQVTTTWHEITKQVENLVGDFMAKDKFNPLYVMKDSGARGSKSNFAQLMGMRGVMSSTTGDDIEIPIKHCFREGIDIAEFFIGTHGSRKGTADTALKTADSGYLTRRLVDVSQDVIVREDDCHSDHGTIVTDITKPNDNENLPPIVVVKLRDRLVGRFTCHDIIDENNHRLIIKGNQYITEEIADEIVQAGIKEVEIRSLFGCQTKGGVCVHCYGKNLATGKLVNKGEAVGIMAAQSIGEPGTQLTMRTFHSGGVSGAAGDITMGLPRVAELFEARNPKGVALISKIAGEITDITQNESGSYTITIKNDLEEQVYDTNVDAKLIVKEGDHVVAGQALVTGSVSPKELLMYADVAAVQRYIAEEVHKIYGAQGITISDKHIEVIIRQMLKKVLILNGGTTKLVPGMKVSLEEFTSVNAQELASGKENARPAVARPIVSGITTAARESDSFLSAASFQETTRVLTDAAIKGKTDYLHGLKERVITGRLIPAGRGLLTEEEEKKIVDNFDVLETMKEVQAYYHSERDKNYEELEEKKKAEALEQEFNDNGVENL